MRKILFASALALSMAMAPAHAVLFDFSYTLAGGDTLAGTLDGTLQPDGNKVIVNSILDFATFNGVDGPSLPLVDDAAMLGGDPFVSLNGDFMDLAACTNPCFDGFFFFGPNLGGLFFSGSSFGGVSEFYDAAGWNLSEVRVPAPATLALMLFGVAGLSSARQRTA